MAGITIGTTDQCDCCGYTMPQRPFQNGLQEPIRWYTCPNCARNCALYTPCDRYTNSWKGVPVGAK